MKRIIIAVLLSGVLGPGVGQLYNREFKKGWALIIFTLVICILFFGALTKATVQMLPPHVTVITPEMAQQILQKLLEKNPTPFHMFKFIILILWVYGIVDAYIGARKRARYVSTINRTDALH